MKSNAKEMEEVSRITVGDLRRMLDSYPSETEITFGHTVEGVPLAFYRLKGRGEGLVQIELNDLVPEVVDGNGVVYLEEVAKGELRRVREGG